jgi:hypothetical protein
VCSNTTAHTHNKKKEKTMSVLNNAHSMMEMARIAGRCSAIENREGTELSYKKAALYREVEMLLTSRFKELCSEGCSKEHFCPGKAFLDVMQYKDQIAALEPSEFNAALLHVIKQYAEVLAKSALDELGEIPVIIMLLKRFITPEEAIRELISTDVANKPLCKRIYDFFRLDVYEYE